MYLKYFLESGIFAQDSKDSESRTLFYFVTDPSTIKYIMSCYNSKLRMLRFIFIGTHIITPVIYILNHSYSMAGQKTH